MSYEQFYVKYKGLNRGYISYPFMSFSDLELSFWFEIRYFKAVFCKELFKGSSFEFVKLNVEKASSRRVDPDSHNP